MKKVLIFSSIIFSLLLIFTSKTHAVYDPKSFPNNKFGIHILFPTELSKAKELVNSSNGDWGYVTIPIQAGDKDIIKWQQFMDDCASLHLIPLVRLATEGDYFNKETWRKPQYNDLVDFANFLNSLNWPVKNRYIIVFNEVNRADEWEGEANPSEYAELLSFAVNEFKAKNLDFFIISSGMDNAAITRNNNYSEYEYFNQMNSAVPGIFNQIDGISSHSYPNPAFAQPPSVDTPRSIFSFNYEREAIDKLTYKKLPIFITETGWDQTVIKNEKTGQYFKQAFEKVWSNEDIIAVTPFLLNAGNGPFEKFSLLNSSGDKNDTFKAIESFPKTKGSPKLNPIRKILGTESTFSNLPMKDFRKIKQEDSGKNLKSFVKWLFFPYKSGVL